MGTEKADSKIGLGSGSLTGQHKELFHEWSGEGMISVWHKVRAH